MADTTTESIALENIRRRLAKSAQVHQSLANSVGPAILEAAQDAARALSEGRKILLCGNGGSAADCQHVAAELTCRLTKERDRRPLAAIALTTDTSFLTAYGNDYGFDGIFERQVAALGQKGDILIAISTSGNSTNIIRAAKQALSMELVVIAFTGQGGAVHQHSTLSIEVPENQTALIQEAHLTLEHVFCEEIENILFGPLPQE